MAKEKLCFKLSGLDSLKSAIVKQAAEDYGAAYMGETIDNIRPQAMMAECAQFFRSEWYEALTNGAIDGERMMKMIKTHELEREIEMYEMMLNDENICSLKAKISFRKKNGGEKKKSVNYIFHGRLADGIKDYLGTQLEELKKELAEVKSE